MEKKIGKFIFFILLVSAAALFQFSFIPVLPRVAAAFNLVLVLAVGILFFWDWRWALATALLAGGWLDMLAFNFFGFHIFALSLAVLAANWILRAWLTNRSLYAWLLLMIITTAVYNLIAGLLLYLFVYDGRAFFLVTADFWRRLVYQSADSAATALLLGALAAAATRRLRPFFLEKT
jgi:hypothetical protein